MVIHLLSLLLIVFLMNITGNNIMIAYDISTKKTIK